MRRRSSVVDGFTCRDRLEQVGDSMARSVLVDRVDGGSPARQAGLRARGLLAPVGGIALPGRHEVQRALLGPKPRGQETVVVRRPAGEERVQLTLAAQERNRTPASDLIWQKLGLQLSPIDADLVTRANRQLHGGLEVVAVNTDSPAARAGIKKGDILVGLHQWETVTIDNVAYVLGHPDLPVFS